MTKNSTIGDLYTMQPAGVYKSEDEYRHELKLVASELFKKQPDGMNLPERVFETIVISLQKHYFISLVELRKRIYKLHKL